MSAVSLPESQQEIAQSNVYNIIFPQRAQILFPFDIKTPDLIKDIGFCQGSDICLDGLYRRFRLSFSILQQSLIDQRIPYGSGGSVIAYIVGQKHNNLPQQHGICNSPLAFPLFPLQYIIDNRRGVHPVQSSCNPVDFQSNICQHGHTSEAGVRVKEFFCIIDLAVGIRDPFSDSTSRRFTFCKRITMEIQKFTE